MCVLFSFTLSKGFISADTAVRRWRRDWPSRAGDVRHDMAWHCRRPAAETRGDRAPMVPFPLLTPQTLLWTRLPPVARLKARGPQGRLVLQGYALDRSGAFRSTKQTPFTVWPRTVMRGQTTQSKLRALQRPIGETMHGTEPPQLPFSRECFAERLEGGFGGVKRGKGNHTVPFSPFVPAGEHRHPPPPKAALPRHVMANIPQPGRA